MSETATPTPTPTPDPSAPTGPVAPLGRLIGRWADPTGAPAKGFVRVAPDPDFVSATLPDGRAMVVTTATVALDEKGAVAVDVVAPGSGVVPSGVWAYTVTVSVAGGWTREAKVYAGQGQVLDLVSLIGGYGGSVVSDVEARLSAIESRLSVQGDAPKKGEPGQPGERGEKGDPGERGEKGEQGLQGPPGERGLPGEKGEKGERGEAGPPGEKGEKGEQGERGERGERGEPGPQGERGLPGEKGERGEKGEPGQAGERGEQGLQGPPGERGLPGEKGEQGEAGPPGAGIDPTELADLKKRLDTVEARPTVLVLGSEDLVPDGTPAGTVIIRKEA